MNFAEYQEAAWRTASEDADIEIMAAIGLGGEAGEYLEHVKKVRFHHHAEDHEKASKELGDVLWYLAVAAKHRGLSLESIAMQNIAKLKARYGAKFDPVKSQRREDPDYDVAPEDAANGATGFDALDRACPCTHDPHLMCCAGNRYEANTNSAGETMMDRVMGAGIFGDSGT